MLQLEDVLQDAPYYHRAAEGAIEIYLMMYDSGMYMKKSSESNGDVNGHDGSDKGDASSQQKDEKEENGDNGDKKEVKARVDEDPEGRSFTHVASVSFLLFLHFSYPKGQKLSVWGEKGEEYLTAAQKFVQPLLQLASDRIRTHLFALVIAVRRKKRMMAVRNIVKAWSMVRPEMAATWDAARQRCSYTEAKGIAHYMTIVFFLCCTPFCPFIL